MVRFSNPDPATMSIQHEDLPNGLRRIQLSGRLDIPGTQAISLPFTTLTAATNLRVLTDISAVDFLASIGIRELIAVAKVLRQRGGKMVLFVGANAQVTKTLEVTGIDQLIPTFSDLAAAEREALG
jgi:anti-sigma B factor antagonist